MSSSTRSRILWTAPIPADVRVPHLVESWAVWDGRVRAWSAHRARLLRALVRLGLPRPPRKLWRTLAQELRALEAAWPRLEYRCEGGRLVMRLTLRPLPPVPEGWRLDLAPDPRRRPRLKGPELATLAALRGETDETLLLDPRGRVREGTRSSLAWWAEGRLWLVPHQAPILPGVTRRLLLRLAGSAGVPVGFRLPRPEELAGCELWLLNARVGIVPALPSPALPCARPDRTRLERWRRRLAALATPPRA